MRAGSGVGKDWEGETGMEWHQRCCRLEEFPGRRGGRAAGIRSVALCNPSARQPSPGLASWVPCCLIAHCPTPTQTDRRRTCTAPESRGPHHTVPCARIASGTAREVSYVSFQCAAQCDGSWSVVTSSDCVTHRSCYSTTMAQHSKIPQVGWSAGEPVSVEQSGQYGRYGRYGSLLARRGDLQVGRPRDGLQTLERCSRRPCRALQCNALHQ